MVKTRSGRTIDVDTTPPVKKAKKIRLTWTHLYIDEKNPKSILTKRKNKYDTPNNSYPFVIAPGTKLYVACIEICNAKWYNFGKEVKYWTYNVFLTKTEGNDWIENYISGEDKWIENSKIIETMLS
jgi:hypothetical protein